MSESKTYFSEYKKLGEPNKRQRLENWKVAIGLQQVDGLTPSKYLVELAKKNINGEISVDEAVKDIATYYRRIHRKRIRKKKNSRQTKFRRVQINC
jgi:hypothetical protein